MRGILSILSLTVAGLSCPIACAQNQMTPTIKDRELIAALIEALDDPDIEVRQNLAVALSKMGDLAVPALIAALDYAKPERRSGAAIALGQIRPPTRSAIPALLKAVRDKDEVVRRHASYALSRIVGREPAPSIDERKPVAPPLDPPPSVLPGGPQ